MWRKSWNDGEIIKMIKILIEVSMIEIMSTYFSQIYKVATND